MWTDPIVAETRKWREELMMEAGRDLGLLTQRLIESQARHGAKLVSLELGKTNKTTQSRFGHNRHRNASRGEVSSSFVLN